MQQHSVSTPPVQTASPHICPQVIRSFPRKLDLASVKYEQVRKLVSRLVQHQTTPPQATQAQVQPLQVQPSQQLDGAPPLMPTISPKLPNGITQKLAVPDQRASTESRFSTSTAGDGSGEAGDDLDAALMDLDRELGG